MLVFMSRPRYWPAVKILASIKLRIVKALYYNHLGDTRIDRVAATRDLLASAVHHIALAEQAIFAAAALEVVREDNKAFAALVRAECDVPHAWQYAHEEIEAFADALGRELPEGGVKR